MGRGSRERLVQRVAKPGLGDFDRAVVDDLSGETGHVGRHTRRWSGRNRPGLAEQSERRFSQANRQRVRFSGQHQRVGRHSDVQLADAGLRHEAAVDVFVAVERRREHAAGDLRDEREAHRRRVLGRQRFDRLRRLADDRRARNVLRRQRDADKVGDRGRRVRDRDVEGTARRPARYPDG